MSLLYVVVGAAWVGVSAWSWWLDRSARRAVVVLAVLGFLASPGLVTWAAWAFATLFRWPNGDGSTQNRGGGSAT